MDYSTQMIARAEHNLMMRSLPFITEYAFPVTERQSKERRLPVLLLRPILAALLHLVTK